jgi:hypothetical protein
VLIDDGYEPADLPGPLRRYQAISLQDKDAFTRLMLQLRGLLNSQSSEERVKAAAELAWAQIESCRSAAAATAEKKSENVGELVLNAHRAMNRLDGRFFQLESNIAEILSKTQFDPGALGALEQWGKLEGSLQRLRGVWLQYIPRRRTASKPCHYSIAEFGRDELGRHFYRGTNYFLTGDEHYDFDSIKLLPPVHYDGGQLAFYYIYKRGGNVEYEGMYGFGKAIAKDVGSPSDFVFSDGFFFNEATRDGHFPYCLRSMKDLSAVSGLALGDVRSNLNRRRELFNWIEQSDILSQWEAEITS